MYSTGFCLPHVKYVFPTVPLCPVSRFWAVSERKKKVITEGWDGTTNSHLQFSQFLNTRITTESSLNLLNDLWRQDLEFNRSSSKSQRGISPKNVFCQFFNVLSFPTFFLLWNSKYMSKNVYTVFYLTMSSFKTRKSSIKA